MRKVTRQALVVAVSDLHLSHQAPSFRSGEPDWYGAMARSIGVLSKFISTVNSPGMPPVVVYPGDVFDKWNPGPELINFAIKHLPKGWAVPGNHDLPHHNYGGKDRSAYWTLVECGVLQDLAPGVATGAGLVNLWGFPWGTEVHPPQPSSLVPDVAVIHAYVWKRGCGHPQADPADKVIGWKARVRGYAAAFFGDNHLGFLSGNVVNCLLPGNYVSGTVQAGLKSFYSGKAVELTTADGLVLRVTGNHPVLTQQGFVIADSIQEGQEVLCGVGEMFDTRLQNEHHAPALIEDVFSSLAKNRVALLTRLPAARGHLHGDGQHVSGDIDVVTTQRELLFYGHSSEPQHVSEAVLHRRAVQAAGIPSSGSGHSSLGGIYGPSPGLVGSRSLGGSLLRGQLGPYNEARLRAGPDRDTGSPKGISEASTRTAEAICNRRDRFTSNVAANRIVKIRKFQYRGHVYDLQTGDGIIVAGSDRSGKGFYISNCGCFMRRRSDEMDTQPCLNVLYEDGEVERVPLETEDCYRAKEVKVDKAQGTDYTAFFNTLSGLGGRVGDFRGALTDRCKDPAMSQGAKRRILSALEGN